MLSIYSNDIVRTENKGTMIQVTNVIVLWHHKLDNYNIVVSNIGCEPRSRLQLTYPQKF